MGRGYEPPVPQYRIPPPPPLSREYRPCMVEGRKKALFHRWVHISQVVPPEITVGGHGGGVVAGVKALVEFEDGTVTEVSPFSVTFLDSKRLFRRQFPREEARG